MTDEAVLEEPPELQQPQQAGPTFLAPEDPDLQVHYLDPLAEIAAVADAAGISGVDMIAWRDLDHPEAGGSELHAASVAERWAAAGLDVRLTASRARGAAPAGYGDGYRILRPAGRYGIFPAVAAQRLAERHLRRPLRESRNVSPGLPRVGTSARSSVATVEIWNGMPFFSPIWARKPHIVFLHHVHDRMWDLVLPRGLAGAGRFLESRAAPRFYRRTPVVTLSESSRDAIVEHLRLDPRQVHVVHPGVEDAFCPGAGRHSRPLVVAVGRLVPYKRFDRLIEVLVSLKARHPNLEAVIAGEGQERPALEELLSRHDAQAWITLPGRIDDEALVALYQRAWVLASPSAFEGWGLTITEAAACGTPAVASPITGHSDAVEDGVSGFLAEPGPQMEERIDALLSDPLLRRRMQKAAAKRASTLTWDTTALKAMQILAGQA